MGPAALLLVFLVVATVVAFVAIRRGEERRGSKARPRLRSVGDALERVRGRPDGGVLVAFTSGTERDQALAFIDDPSNDDVLEPFACVTIDAFGEGKDVAEAIAKKYGEKGLLALPFILFLDAKGQRVGSLEIDGPDAVNKFLFTYVHKA